MNKNRSKYRTKYRTKYRRAIPWPLVALALTLTAAPGVAQQVSLPGSDFEIDVDADLVVDAGLTLDWSNTNANSSITTDTASGSGDNAFGQGSKEDTPVPTVVSGSIPPNKSDLLNFGVLFEENVNGRFLHLFWRRINNPSGTTNMDFEFNQSGVISGNGVTPVRTPGDALIQYDLANGGTNPELFLALWITGSGGETAADCEASNKLPCWGQRLNLTGAALATGSINTSPIPAGSANGLGAIDPFTFGEATVDFDALTASTDPDSCTSFGSAYLKSRSSDSFSAAMKDFIAPIPTNISNCGKIEVLKFDDSDPALPLQGALFELYVDNPPLFVSGDPDPGIDTLLAAFPETGPDGRTVLDDIFQGDYIVCEIPPPPDGHELADPRCQGVEVTADETVSLSFTNTRIPATIDIVKLDDAVPPTPLAGAEFTLYRDVDENGAFSEPPDASTGQTCTTDAGGACTIDNILPPGFYCVVETVTPANHDTAAPQCLQLDLAQTVELTFINPRQRGAILVTKTRKHAASGLGVDHPHPGVTFSVDGASGVTDAAGQVCFDGLLFGDYEVTETLPNGYVADGGDLTKSVTVDAKSECGDGNEAAVGFSNTPLTDITVSVHSQVPGGTISSIDCVLDQVALSDNPSLTLSNLLPGEYTCTIVVDP